MVSKRRFSAVLWIEEWMVSGIMRVIGARVALYVPIRNLRNSARANPVSKYSKPVSDARVDAVARSIAAEQLRMAPHHAACLL